MIMTSTSHSDCRESWQTKFVEMLPRIEKLLVIAFRNLTPEARANACEEGLFHCVWSYSHLFEQGRAGAATPGSLVWYAMVQVRSGRVAGCPLNERDVLSRYAQLNHGFQVVPLLHQDSDDDRWIDDVADARHSTILDQVAIRMDFRAWLRSLSSRTRQIALDLAKGFDTREVSRKHHLTPGRISQMRRELKESWQKFSEPELVGAR
jgi:hypothetical protein